MRSTPYGVGGTLLDLGIDEHPARATLTQRVARALGAALPDADVVVGAGTVLIVRPGAGEQHTSDAGEEGRRALEQALRDVSRPLADVAQHDLHVVYDGPDLSDLAEAAQLSVPEIVERHVGRSYVVEVVGFLPGFGYLGPLDPALVRPRRQVPRKRVAASSVGVAGEFTGVYPFASPGGWHLIGRAVEPHLFDLRREPPGRFRAGDVVRFQPVPADEVAPPGDTAEDSHAGDVPTIRPALEMLRVPPGVTVQDGGRVGQMGRGVPPSGALDAQTLEKANRAVGNHPGAAAVEVPLNRLVVRAHGALSVSVDGQTPLALRSGDELEVAPSERAVRYLAVKGGIDVPEVLGSRSTLLVAGLGGFGGRMLRKGDRLCAAQDGAKPVSGASHDASHAELDDDAVSHRPTVLTAVRGPRAREFPSGVWGQLERHTFRVSPLGNRVGVRLEGTIPRIGVDAGLPMPMVRGAIQVSTDGTPIVLGPDHAVTGGYPVIAVLTPSAMMRLARLRPGRAVRFEWVR